MTRARLDLRAGQIQQPLALMAAFAAVVSGFEAYIQHLRGAFSHWLMWTPVWLTPPTAMAAGAAIFSERAARKVLLPLALVDGVVGFFYHVRGIQRMPGGFTIGQYNIVMGPPIFAPLLLSSVGVLGILASLLRRERLVAPGQPAAPEAELLRNRRKQSSRTLVRKLSEDIAHGRFQQVMALVSAFFAVLAGGEAYFEHLRGSFNRRWMWTPVWVTPPMVVAAIGAARSEDIARRILPVTSVVTLIDGLIGFTLHLRGIQHMPGGFHNVRFNITLGPPLFAPLLFCAVGLLGFLAAVLKRSECKAE